MNTNTPWSAPIARTTEESPDHIGEELRHYDAYLRDLRGLSSGSRIGQLRVAGRFLHQAFGDAVVDIAVTGNGAASFSCRGVRRTIRLMSKQGEGRRWQSRGRRHGGDAAARNGGRCSIGSRPAGWASKRSAIMKA